ncbi:hemocyte protein-glutamine gamma-glutamyltransferase-like [Diorhabda carinulata]|uniref:hemocyte protein-glutamine gamma-glutamyltransferase-like n=1 Tax=Diorhabda carinulata TaxID=1163345 RepID=UPI00259FEC2B|nr:hemocyte protein-glutamine gamma-glutamyltransferase-like [Diorhabda carinulata]XP_057672515.1 hemocyte protein-glutamine gamma-glutamyltransferase-like [Diorhabda carinulata]
MEPITVTGVNFFCQENSKHHHTDEYELVKAEAPAPVLRRGESFLLGIDLDRTFDVEKDVIRISFGFGEKPTVILGTKSVTPVKPKHTHFPKDPHIWGVLLKENNGNSVILNVRIPPHVQVGVWNCSLITTIAGKRGMRKDYNVENDVYIIFNPWCKEDGVYMENEEERNEYVLNETGKIWTGTFKKPKGKHWIFGQFDDISLPAAVFLLEKSGLATAQRGNPIMVARAISAIINALDDDGLLEGRWDGDYSDGTSPFAWTGTGAILEQYLATNGTPVKYGQCWVYSAATVTVCRALGMPCRSTTNYVSAHDTNATLTVDKFFDIFGEKIEGGLEGAGNDSCWNFHVWNDVWMTRPDLPPGYGGWQVIDATPQEVSGTVMRCGPASIVAVKKGEIGFLYDTPFVFSEVNADVVHFQENDESDWGFSRISINQYHVGRMILTKRLGPIDDNGDNDYTDITDLFKNKEGSEAERLAVYNAVRGVPKAKHIYDIPGNENQDVEFDLVDIETVPYGHKFNMQVRLENKSDAVRTVKIVMTASSVYYMGTTANDIKKTRGTLKLEPHQRETVRLEVFPKDYLNKLVDHFFVKLYAVANVEETKQVWSEEDDFNLTLPDIKITAPVKANAGDKVNIKFSFRNPLEIPLTQCSYTVEGPGINKKESHADVKPKETIVTSASFVAKKPGSKKIIVNFTSKEIHNAHGSTNIIIE